MPPFPRCFVQHSHIRKPWQGCLMLESAHGQFSMAILSNQKAIHFFYHVWFLKSCGAAGICAVRVSMVFWKLGLRLSSNFTAKLAVISPKDEAEHGEISSMNHFAKKKIRQMHTVSQNTYSVHSFIEPVFGLPQIPWNPSWSPSEENGRSQTKTLSWRVMRRKMRVWTSS